MLLCSYSKCTEWRDDETDGKIHLFSLALRNRPEFTLTCQYEVTKALFNPFDPHLVIGATSSGYLMQWDTRIKNGLPVLKSCLSKHGHKQPIYSLNIVGSENAHNIVSVSTNG